MRRFFENRKRTLTLILAVTLLASLLSLCYVFTRPTELAVTVRDAETGAPLSGVIIEVQNPNGQTLIDMATDDRGQAAVRRLAPDVGYWLLARQIDYVPALQKGVSVRLHKTTLAEFALRPQPGGRLYIGAERAYVAIVDTASYRFVALEKGPPELGNWPIWYVVPYPQASWLYVSARYRNYVLDLTNLKPVKELSIPGPVYGMVLNRERNSLLVIVGRRGGQIAVINPNSAEVERELEVQQFEVAMTAGMLVVGPEAELYITAGLVDADLRLAVTDLRTGDTVIVPIGFVPRWAALSADGNHLFLGNPEGTHMARYDRRVGQIDRMIEVGPGISAIGVHPDGQEIYLANQRLGLLTVMDAETLTVVTHVPVGSDPVAVAVDSRGERVYVANAKSGDISVMSARRARIVGTIELGAEIYSIAAN